MEARIARWNRTSRISAGRRRHQNSRSHAHHKHRRREGLGRVREDLGTHALHRFRRGAPRNFGARFRLDLSRASRRYSSANTRCNSSNATGFVMCALNPASAARCTSAACPYPVSATSTSAPVLRANSSRHLVPVHLGQPDVEQHHVGVRRAHPLERVAAGVRGVRLLAAEPEQRGERIGGVRVVVHDEHAPRIRSSLAVRGRGPLQSGRARERQPNLERRAAAGSLARG